MNHLHLQWMWERTRTGYWFVPAVMTLGTVGLALGLGALDKAMQATSTAVASLFVRWRSKLTAIPAMPIVHVGVMDRAVTGTWNGRAAILRSRSRVRRKRHDGK